MKKFILMLFIVIFSGACSEQGPQKTLDNMAKALEAKEPKQFLNQIDMPRFAAAQISNMTKTSEPLRALDSVGRMLGLGGMEHLIGAVGDMQGREEERFTHEISSGKLVQMCAKSQNPDCPWVPESLREAKIVDISEGIAVAQITTPANISSWLALTKIGDAWKVVGQSPLKDDAINFAQGKKRNIKPALDKDAPAPPPAPSPTKSNPEQPEEPVRF